MTISSTTRKAGPFPGNGVTVALPFEFKVFTAADVLAVQAVTATGAETTLALGTDYTVSLNADQDTSPGGTLTLVAAHATGTSVTLTSQVENLQGTDLTNLGGFYPKVINDALDRATIQIQQLAEKLSRVLTFGISSGASGSLPNPTPLGLLGWNAAGTALQNFAGGASAAVSTFMANVVAAADAAAAQTALGASAVGRALFGAVDAAAARLGIGAAASGANNDITSLASPALGAATATTQAGTDSTTKVATTAQVQAALAQSGKVLQTVTGTGAGGSVSAATLTAVGTGIAFTPKSTSSKIIVECAFQGFISNAASYNVGIVFQLAEATAGLLGSSLTLQPISAAGGTGAYAAQVAKAVYANSSIASKTFDLRICCSGSGTGATSTASALLWTITEVQN